MRGDLDPAGDRHVDVPRDQPGQHAARPTCRSPTTTAARSSRCRTSGPNSGDTSPQNGLLDPGESWVFRCVQSVATPASTDPDGQNIVNTAEATGTDPEGTVVTDDASDDVDAFNPAIDAHQAGRRLRRWQRSRPDRQVTYTYAVSNDGQHPARIGVRSPTTRHRAPIPTRGPDGPGNGDNVLDVGETWTYSCDLASPTRDVINTASVTGTPLDPTRGNEPFPNPNPDVRATDTAEVRVVNPAIELTKTATPDVVLLDPGRHRRRKTSRTPSTATEHRRRASEPPGRRLAGPAPRTRAGSIDRRCTSPRPMSAGTPTATTCSTPTRPGSSPARRRSSDRPSTSRRSSASRRTPTAIRCRARPGPTTAAGVVEVVAPGHRRRQDRLATRRARPGRDPGGWPGRPDAASGRIPLRR